MSDGSAYCFGERTGRSVLCMPRGCGACLGWCAHGRRRPTCCRLHVGDAIPLLPASRGRRCCCCCYCCCPCTDSPPLAPMLLLDHRGQRQRCSGKRDCDVHRRVHPRSGHGRVHILHAGFWGAAYLWRHVVWGRCVLGYAACELAWIWVGTCACGHSCLPQRHAPSLGLNVHGHVPPPILAPTHTRPALQVPIT